MSSYALGRARKVKVFLDVETFHWHIWEEVRPAPYREEVAKSDLGSWEGVEKGPCRKFFPHFTASYVYKEIVWREKDLAE